MNKTLIRILICFAGLAVGIGLIILIQGIGQEVYPTPEDVKAGKPEAVKNYLRTAPLMALLMVPISYLFGGLGATLVTCKWTKGHKVSILIVGALLIIATILNLFQIKHPTWLAITNIVAIVFPLCVGLFLAPRCREVAATDA